MVLFDRMRFVSGYCNLQVHYNLYSATYMGSEIVGLSGFDEKKKQRTYYLYKNACIYFKFIILNEYYLLKKNKTKHI